MSSPEVPLKVITRKVLHRNARGTSPKVSIPRWWVGDRTEELILEIYPDKIVVRRRWSDAPAFQKG